MSDTIATRTARFLATIPGDQMPADIARLCELDRYQASTGAARAAELVAGAAERSGLTAVELLRFPADGAVRWWSFAAPSAWTPTTARLQVAAGTTEEVVVDHATTPCSVATYSASTPQDGIVGPLVAFDGGPSLPDDVRGAIVVVDRAGFAALQPLSRLQDAGAAGIVTDAGCVRDETAEHAGRLELDPGTALIGFSVTTSCLDRLRVHARAGAAARATVIVDRSATMPAVTGVLPGRTAGPEVWITAHLCHPRPSANDNASGVAAALAVAAAHAAMRRRDPDAVTDRTLRFVWAPEFVGTAAVLHRHLAEHGDAAAPAAAINLDMVGEDQALCGGPFLLERPPARRPTPLTAVAEQAVDAAFALTGHAPGTWRSVPFAGSSDHAVLADPKLACPALALCHAPDRFNHSGADDLGKVSETELRRAAAAAAVVAEVAAGDPRRRSPAIGAAVSAWCARERLRAQETAERHAGIDDGRWSEQLIRAVGHELRATWALAADRPAPRAPGPPTATGPRLVGRWDGPLNLRALLHDLRAETRAEVQALIRADKDSYALLHNLAMRSVDRLDRDALIATTSYDLRHPVPQATAQRLIDALLESGWVQTTA